MRAGNAARIVLVGLTLILPSAFLGLVSAPAAVAVASVMATAVTNTDGSSDTFTSDFYLGRDADGNATLRTVETIVPVFPDTDVSHGIERAIPLKRDGIPLDLQVIAVKDADGVDMPHSRTEEGGFTILRIGSAPPTCTMP